MVCVRHGHQSSHVLAICDVAPFSGRGFGQNELIVRTHEGVMSTGLWMQAWVKCPTWVRGIEGVTCLAGVVNTSVSLQGALFAEIRIRIILVKVWNAAGNWMVAIFLQRIAETFDLAAVVWRWSEQPTIQPALKVLGKLGNHPDFALAHFECQNISHQLFLDRIPLLQDVQAAWLLVVLCGTGNYMSGATNCASSVLRGERNSDVASFRFLRRRLMTQDRLRAHLSFLQGWGCAAPR